MSDVQVEELNIDLEPGDIVDDILGENLREFFSILTLRLLNQTPVTNDCPVLPHQVQREA